VLSCSDDDDSPKVAAETYFEVSPEANVTLPVWVLSPSADETALVIVHGGPGVGAIGFFDPEQAVLKEIAKVHPTIIYDQRSAGGIIQGKPGTDISINKHVSDLKFVVDEVKKRYSNIKKVVLLGHSWGVQLSAKFAGCSCSFGRWIHFH